MPWRVPGMTTYSRFFSGISVIISLVASLRNAQVVPSDTNSVGIASFFTSSRSISFASLRTNTASEARAFRKLFFRDDLPLVSVLGHHERGQALGLFGRPLVEVEGWLEEFAGDKLALVVEEPTSSVVVRLTPALYYRSDLAR